MSGLRTLLRGDGTVPAFRMTAVERVGTPEAPVHGRAQA